jgi:hypothetical protein
VSRGGVESADEIRFDVKAGDGNDSGGGRARLVLSAGNKVRLKSK